MKSKDGLRQRIWYAAASLVAQSLEGEDGFDRGRFQAAFNRYLTRRLQNPLVQPWISAGIFLSGVERTYQVYLDRLAELKNFDPETLRETYREARDEFRKTQKPHMSLRLMPGRQLPWFGERLYRQFIDEGLEWKITPDNTINLSLQNAESRERPDSSHRVNLHYYSGGVNRLLGRVIGRVIPGLDIRALWAPGMVASYESKNAAQDKDAAFLLGSLLDIGAKTEAGVFGLHSYFGFPVSINFSGGERPDNPYSPELEVGFNFRRETEKGLKIFLGGMSSISVFPHGWRYFGLIGRVEM